MRESWKFTDIPFKSAEIDLDRWKPWQDMDAAPRRWERTGPEVIRLLHEYEKFHIGPTI